MPRIWLGAFLVFAASCNGAENRSPVNPGGKTEIFVGSYLLQTVDGATLPSTFPPAGPPVEITRGTLTIRPDGSFILIDYLRNLPAPGGVGSEESGGTYQTTDTDISLIFQNKVVTGSLAGDNLTLHRGAPSFLYRR